MQRIIPFLLVLLFQLTLTAQFLPRFVITNGDVRYMSNEIIIKLSEKVKSDPSGNVILNLETFQQLREAKVTGAKLLFNSSQLKSTGLDRIVSVTYLENTDPLIVASKLARNPLVEWAEPRYVYESTFVPNDPSLGLQWALTKISAASAWDLSTGDTSVVIGIVDTGVDWDHPDLNANIKRNWGEIPNNNIDDDNNGYVDDFLGWDFGGLVGIPDPDPMEDQPDHGTHVAGISSAVTNNAIGVSSIGFNCKLLAVKTCQNNNRNPSNQPYIIYGYEGIMYAAMRGAKVINCSWGGGGYSILGQAVIDQATEMGALVVAAAGNNNSDDLFYPASYDKVLSVASTNQGDQKSSFSNYGTAIDVSAPGESIYNTWMDDTYLYLSGTSMASPLAAGLAGLVRSKFPSLSPVQAAERIRATADNINTANPAFTDQLGKGRINAFKALSNETVTSVRGYNIVLSDAEGGDGDGVFENGESISVRAYFKNYLSPVTGLSIGLESTNLNANVTMPTIFINQMGTLDSTSNNATPFRFTITTAAQNAPLRFKFNYAAAGYADYQWIKAVANPTYATQSGNDVAVTITSKGTLAYNDYPSNLQGTGFKYKGSSNYLFEGALMLATSASNVSDAARNSSGGSAQNADFTVVKPFTLRAPGAVADVEGDAVFNDNAAGASKLGVTVKLNSYTYTSAPYDNFIILRYKIINNTTSAISNLYGGLFFDWDLVDGSGTDDYTQWDTTGFFGYVYHLGGSPDDWVASALISDNKYGFWGILNAGGDGGFQIYDGFSDSEKWQALSSGIGKARAGGGDVSNVVSSGPHNISPGDSISIAFALAGASDLAGLRNAVSNARNKYISILTDVIEEKALAEIKTELFRCYPNPATERATISFALKKGGAVSLKVYDIIGNKVAVLVEGALPTGKHNYSVETKNLPSGIYFYELVSEGFKSAGKLVVMK